MNGRTSVTALVVLGILVSATAGCRVSRETTIPVAPPEVPRELDKVTHPTYLIEPPDILVIEAYKGVPKPPHKIEPLDVLTLVLEEPLPNQPLQGQFTVDADGTIELGPTYGGRVRLDGKTIPEARAAIEQHLTNVAKLRNPKLTLTLSQSRTVQRISGTHLVRPDGTVGLGAYGSVSVVGLNLTEAKQAIQVHLANFLVDPEVAVDVQGFNSKLFYIIQDGAGSGQTVTRLPCTGNETVLDAIAQVNGLSTVSSTDRIWVARPAPAGSAQQILPVNWSAVVAAGDTSTNYQLLPGDRVYVASQPLIALETRMARILAPVERLIGVTLLGTNTFYSFRGQNGINNGGFNR